MEIFAETHACGTDVYVGDSHVAVIVKGELGFRVNGCTFDLLADAIEDVANRTVNAVRSGALILDQVKPNWFELVDTDSLNMLHMDRCIIGQVFGVRGEDTPFVVYRDALEHIGLNQVAGDEMLHGFDGGEDGFLEYGILKELWIEEIERRKN